MMTDLFVYGTLRHVPLLEIVLNRPAKAIDLIEVTLPDHVALSAAEGPFPLIAEQPGHAQKGLLLRNLSADDMARLNFYEGGFAYDLRRKRVSNGQMADVFFPPATGVTAQGEWHLQDWEREWGALSCFAAQEVMGFYGRRSTDEIARMFPMIRSRALAKLHGRHSRHGAGTFDGKVKILKETNEYTDFFALNSYEIEHEKFDGTASGPLKRAVFVGTDAAILLPYDPHRDRVLLVEQFRMGPLARADRKLWQFEPVAGRVDAGETPQDCARREAFEEAGLHITTLECAAEAYASPGCSSEFFYMYVGLCDLPDDIVGVGGLDGENEDIRSHLFSFDALMQLVESKACANTPLATLSYWLAYHRADLRGFP